VVAEVHNTPWGERHAYVIEGTAGRTPKAMHVSPFLGMDLEHDFRFTTPGPRLGVRIEDLRDGRRVLSASLALRRRDISGPLLAGLLIRFPWTSLRTLLAIYAQALRLWLRGAPVHSHPAPSRGAAP